jgi:hypothetical protein
LECSRAEEEEGGADEVSCSKVLHSMLG